MSNEEEQVQKLIRLKRYEVPREGYFDDFLEEFQNRRAGELEAKPSPKGIFGQWAAKFSWMGSGRLVAAGGLAYAALLVLVLMWPKGPEGRLDNREPVIFQPGPEDVTPPAPKPPGDQPEEF